MSGPIGFIRSATLPHSADSSRSPETPTRLEVYAQYERHMQECDALISARIGCSPAYWAGQRERCFVYWEHEYSRARSLPPPRDPAAFAPGEYLRWSERHPHPAASRWDWLGWGAVILAGGVFFGERIPGVHELLTSGYDFLAEMLKGVL